MSESNRGPENLADSQPVVPPVGGAEERPAAAGIGLVTASAELLKDTRVAFVAA